MVNYCDAQMQAWLTANAGRDVVPQGLTDKYSSAPKIDSERTKTDGRLTENLVKNTDTFNANLDMKIQAWKARIIKEVRATPVKNNKRSDKFEELLGQVGREMQEQVSAKIKQAKKLFNVSVEPNLWETVALVFALNDCKQKNDTDADNTVISARNFFTKYYKLYDDDRKFNIKLFCGRALYAKGKLDYKIEKLARGADQKMKRASWQTSNAGRDDVDVNSI